MTNALKEGTIKTNEYQVVSTNMSDLIRKDSMDDKEYLVAPVILLTPGVFNDILYLPEELAKFPEAWNGRPIPVYHPEDPWTGKKVCCNDPKILEQRKTGQLFNSKWEDDKLKSEAWIDPEKANKVDKDVMIKLQNNEMMEISTGLFMDYEVSHGQYNGKSYSFIGHNFRPDHMALLPQGIGACSIDDGAGLPRTNQQKEDKNVSFFKRIQNAVRDCFNRMSANELSHDDVRSQLRDDIKAFVNPKENEFIFIRDVFDKTCVYEYETKDSVKLYQIDYAVDAQDKVSLVGDSVEVIERTEYIPATNQDGDKGQETLTEGDSKMDRKEQIDALIANKDSQWGEDDRELLVYMSDDQFKRLTVEDESKDGAKAKADPAPQIKAVDESEKKEEPIVNAEKKEEEDPKPAKTAEEFIQNAPEEMQEVLHSGLSMHRKQKAELVANLLDNDRNTFTKEELEEKSPSELEKIAELGQVKVDFSGQGGGPAVNTEEEPLVAPVANYSGSEDK